MARSGSLFLFSLLLPIGARRSIRIVDSRNSIRIDGSRRSAQQQNVLLGSGLDVSVEAREALVPAGTGISHRADLQGALDVGSNHATRRSGDPASRRIVPRFRSGPHRARITLQEPPKKQKKKSKMPKQKVKAPPAAALIVPEQTFFEGPPSITETIIPGASVLTVVGIIPFSASLARQAWTRYKITDRRIEVASGFQGKDVVQILYREIVDLKWLRRFGGACGDLVFSLQDGSKLEMRSVSDFDRNLAFIVNQLPEGIVQAIDYPDKPAMEYRAKVDAGEAEPPTLPPPEGTPAKDATQ